ncbi:MULTISPECIES: peptide chain release factor 2 [Leptospirillum]|uniref:peptide chain release factor 2 n=1 Tax=Leptospirillum TaxID=179 RepID=UPI001C4E107C|nr:MULTISPECIES: peptide chain release factor 2 [Leptospirillum]
MTEPTIESLRELFDGEKQRVSQIRRHLDADRLKVTLEQIDAQSQSPEFWKDSDRARKMLREKSRLEKRLSLIQGIEKEDADIRALFELASDPDFLAELSRRVPEFSESVKAFELEEILSDAKSDNPAFLEIHPGAGGTESQDWAQMLLRMYIRWAERHGMTVEVIDIQSGEEAGIKSATILVRGEHAFGYLMSESGIHRLVRISPFDANKRRHTSFTSVFVYPELEDDIPVEIRDEDIRIDTFRASSAGGQHVNKTSSAIRLTHLPTGIVISSQNERSQLQNREMAFKVLRAKLYELEEKRKKEELDKISGAQNKKEIGWGHQIRSYVLQPYQLIKDHRTGLETGKVSEVLDGDLDMFIRGYLLARWNGTLGTGAPESDELDG